MSFGYNDGLGDIPIIFPSKSHRKEEWICAYLKRQGRVTVPMSVFEELLKDDELVRVVAKVGKDYE